MNTQPNGAFRELLALLGRLDEARIAYDLRRSRDDALMIKVNVPGDRWEIEFVDYDDEVRIEIERFHSNGEIYDETMLSEIFKHASNGPDTDTHESAFPDEAVA